MYWQTRSDQVSYCTFTYLPVSYQSSWHDVTNITILNSGKHKHCISKWTYKHYVWCVLGANCEQQTVFFWCSEQQCPGHSDWCRPDSTLSVHQFDLSNNISTSVTTNSPWLIGLWHKLTRETFPQYCMFEETADIKNSQHISKITDM